MSTNHSYVLVLVVLFSNLSNGFGWRCFSSPYSGSKICFDGSVANFSVESPDDGRAKERLAEARRKMGGTNPCWLRAYGNLFSSCSDICADEETRKRLSWDLTDCFQKDSGRSSLPSCGEKTSSNMIDCTKKLNSDEHRIYLEFYLETNSICYQLQSKAFSIHVESLVNELIKDSAKLESIDEKSASLMCSSDQLLHESLDSIHVQTTRVSDTLRNMLDHVNTILTHSKELQEQAQGIASSLSELVEGQEKMMRDKLEEDKGRVKDSYNDLGREIDNLQSICQHREGDE